MIVQTLEFVNHFLINRVAKVLELVGSVEFADLSVEVVAWQTMVSASLDVEGRQRPSFGVFGEEAIEQPVVQIRVGFKMIV